MRLANLLRGLRFGRLRYFLTWFPVRRQCSVKMGVKVPSTVPLLDSMPDDSRDFFLLSILGYFFLLLERHSREMTRNKGQKWE